MIKYLICIFICIFVILVKLSILSYLQDTRGCIFYLVSKILFESIFPNPAYSLLGNQSCRYRAPLRWWRIRGLPWLPAGRRPPLPHYSTRSRQKCRRAQFRRRSYGQENGGDRDTGLFGKRYIQIFAWDYVESGKLIMHIFFVQAADWQRSKPRKQASGISLAFLHCRTLASACHIPYKSGKSRGDKRYIDIFIGLLRISRPRGASTWD